MYNNRQFWMDNVKFGWSCPMTSHYFNPCNKKGHIADICHSICRLDKHEDDTAFDKEEQTYNVNLFQIKPMQQSKKANIAVQHLTKKDFTVQVIINNHLE